MGSWPIVETKSGCLRGVGYVVITLVILLIILAGIGLRWNTYEYSGPEQTIQIISIFGRKIIFTVKCVGKPGRSERIWFAWDHPMTDSGGGTVVRTQLDRNGDGMIDVWTKAISTKMSQVRIDIDCDGNEDIRFVTDKACLDALLAGIPETKPCIPEYPCSRILPYGLTINEAAVVCSASETRRRKFWWNVGIMEAILQIPREDAERLAYQYLFSGNFGSVESEDLSPATIPSAGPRGEE